MMFTPTTPKAISYADLLLEVGVNLQAGQGLLVTGSLLGGVDLRLAPFIEIVAEKAYQLGARHVAVIWRDPALERAWLQHASIDSIGVYPGWFGQAVLEHFQAGDALLMLYAEDPELHAGLDARLISAAQTAMRQPSQAARAFIHRDAINWCVAAVPIPPWSAKVLPELPEDRRDLALWDLILKACRFDHPDPLSGWREHLDALATRADWLNGRQFSSLRYTAPGTQLSVGLPRGHLWQGGESVSQTGIRFVANLPTEEIFTLPHKDQVEGVVTATRPLQYGGKTIDGLSLVFSRGRVVEYSAQAGTDLLGELVRTDEGSARLGEVALVPHSAPLGQMGLVFHNMLFDENAGSHLALGSGLRVSLVGGAAMGDEEFWSLGGNLSQVHYDFTIGSAVLDVDGLTSSGEAEPILRGGEWAFPA